MSKLRLLHVANNVQAAPNFPMRNGILNAIDCVYKEIDWVAVHHAHKEKGVQDAISGMVKQFSPDITFMQIQHPGIIDADFARYLSDKTFVVNWTGDVREDISWFERTAPYFGVTLFSNNSQPKLLQAKGLRSDFLQVGFDEKTYFPNGNTSDGGIVFMGNCYPQLKFPLEGLRHSLSAALAKNFESQFHLYGSGWNIKGVGATFGMSEVEVKAYRDCRIAINCSHFNLSRYSSDRMLRIMGSGAFCLSHRYEDIHVDFEEGVHLVSWESVEELIDKAKFWMDPARDAARRKIAQAGCNLVHAKFRWINRFIELAGLINTYQSKDMSVRKNDGWIDHMKFIMPERTYSQFGEESYIGFIFNNIGAPSRTFCNIIDNVNEFSNTRMLHEKYAWGGVEMGANENFIEVLSQGEMPEKFDLLNIYLKTGQPLYMLKNIYTRYNPRLVVVRMREGLESLEKVLLEEKLPYKVIHHSGNVVAYLLHKSELITP